MSNIPVVYGVEIDGTAEAAREIERLGNTMSDGFKKATREAGEFAGTLGKSIGGLVDDFTGFAGTIAGGGAAGGAASIVGAIALASKAWQEYTEWADKARKQSEDAAEQIRNQVNALRGIAESSMADDTAGKTYAQLKNSADVQFKIVRGIEEQAKAQADAVVELQRQVDLQAKQMALGMMVGNDLKAKSDRLVVETNKQKELAGALSQEKQRLDRFDAVAAQRFVDEKNTHERKITLETRAKLRKRAEEDAEEMRKYNDDKADQAGKAAGERWRRQFAALAESEARAWETITDSFGDRRGAMTEGIDAAAEDMGWIADATREYNDVVAEGVVIQKNAALARENITIDEKEKILKNIDDVREARERAALNDRLDAINIAEQIGEIDSLKASAMRETDRQITEERIKNRQLETKISVEEMRKQEDQQKKNLAVQRAMALATMEYGVAMTAVTPIVQSFTSDLALLGEINRDNWRDMVMQGEELPKIIAKKAQAILAGIAQEAAGKSLMAAADATFQMAVGFGMLAIGNAAGANAAFAASALAAASSVSYGALAGGAGAGALAIGMARGDSAGSLIGLTKEEREERDRKRGGASNGGGPMGGSSNSRGRQDSGQAVTYITMEFGALSIAPENPRRVARAFGQAQRIASRDGFARLNG